VSERRYWARLALFCGLGGLLLFYLVLNLTVKGGKVSMPDLKGMGRAAAEYKLRGLGLHMGVREERFSTGAPYGAVLEQDIEPGATIKRGRTVELILSKGTKLVAMPQLAGLPTLRQGRLLLEQNGLEPGVEDWIDSELPQGTVLAQTPEAGAEIPRGTRVSLLCSLGPRKASWVMPSLLGSGALLARSVAARMGLVLRKVVEKELPGLAPGSVAAQSLSPGARVEEGSELNLVLASGNSELEGARLAEILFDVPEDGVTERRVLITVSDGMGVRAVYNRMVRPGDSVKLQVRVHGAASYSVSLAGSPVESKEIP